MLIETSGNTTSFVVLRGTKFEKIMFDNKEFSASKRLRCPTCGRFLSRNGKQHICLNMMTLDEVEEYHGHDEIPADAWVCETCYGSGTHHPEHDPLECPDCNGDGYR